MMSHDGVDPVFDFMFGLLPDDPIIRVYGDLLRLLPRTVDMTDVKEHLAQRRDVQEYIPDEFTAESGVFMGDPMAFAI